VNAPEQARQGEKNVKKRLLTLIVAVAAALTTQMAVTSPAQASTKKTSTTQKTSTHKKHHKHTKKTADARMASPAA
jgi:hypothetical protein